MTDFVQEFLGFLLELVFWYLVVGLVLKLIQRRLIEYNQETEKLVKHIVSRVHSVTVEQHGEMIYWYDTDDNIFIAQGRTVEEIQQILRQRWQQHIFLLEKQQILLTGPEFTPIRLETSLTK